MIFIKGGNISRNEKWLYKNEPITVTSEFTYLGMSLAKLSFRKHILARNNSSKNSINSTYKSFVNKPDISITTK